MAPSTRLLLLPVSPVAIRVLLIPLKKLRELAPLVSRLTTLERSSSKANLIKCLLPPHGSLS